MSDQQIRAGLRALLAGGAAQLDHDSLWSLLHLAATELGRRGAAAELLAGYFAGLQDDTLALLAEALALEQEQRRPPMSRWSHRVGASRELEFLWELTEEPDGWLVQIDHTRKRRRRCLVEITDWPGAPRRLEEEA